MAMLTDFTTLVAGAIASAVAGLSAAVPATITLAPTSAEVGEHVSISGVVHWGTEAHQAGECFVKLDGVVMTSATCSFTLDGTITGGFDVPVGAAVRQHSVSACAWKGCSGDANLWAGATTLDVVAPRVLVADIRCLAYDTAKEVLAGDGLVFSPAEGTSGMVGWQDPLPDAKVPGGTPVRAGPALVPELRGLDAEQAEIAVGEACGSLTTEGDTSATITGQAPEHGEPMPADGSVLAIFPKVLQPSEPTPSDASTSPPTDGASTITPEPSDIGSPDVTDDLTETPKNSTEPTATEPTSAGPTTAPPTSTESAAPGPLPSEESKGPPSGRGGGPQWVLLTGAGALATSALVGGVLLLRGRGLIRGVPAQLDATVQARSVAATLDERPPGRSTETDMSYTVVRHGPVTRLEEEPR